MAERQVMQIVGDGVTGRWVTWRWGGQGRSGGVGEVPEAARVTDRLRAALVVDGALTDRAAESELMTDLGMALLPAPLREQLLGAAHTGQHVEVRVAPSPSAAAVPWGLLVLNERGTRLLDVADVSWIAPLLPRDVSEPAGRVSWAEARGLPSLHILDPAQDTMGRVLEPGRPVAVAGQASGAVVRGTRFGAVDLAEALAGGLSRLFLLGHCVTSRTAASTGFVLSDSDGAWPVPLDAATLLRAPERWPMPPRVAVVACASGVDMADHEPFGLATALLHAGADAVQATLWTLPTDQGLRRADPASGPAFTRLAEAIDRAQLADDPVQALCSWQRGRLAEWRRPPSPGTSPLETSPLVWGSAMTMTAPSRRLGQQNRHSPPLPIDDTPPSM